MALVNRVLCFKNTRHGTIFVSIFSVILFAASLIVNVIHYIGQSHIFTSSIAVKVAIYCLFGSNTIILTLSFILLAAARLDRKLLMLPWLLLLIPTCLTEGASILFLVYMNAKASGPVNGVSSIDIFIMSFFVLRVACLSYCYVCTTSQYQELAAGRGSWLYFYKTEERRRRSLAFLRTLGDAESIGVQITYSGPPPYSEHPPLYTEATPGDEADLTNIRAETIHDHVPVVGALHTVNSQPQGGVNASFIDNDEASVVADSEESGSVHGRDNLVVNECNAVSSVTLQVAMLPNQRIETPPPDYYYCWH